MGLREIRSIWESVTLGFGNVRKRPRLELMDRNPRRRKRLQCLEPRGAVNACDASHARGARNPTSLLGNVNGLLRARGLG